MPYIGSKAVSYTRSMDSGFLVAVEILHTLLEVGSLSLVILSAVTHTPFHASVLRPVSQVGPTHNGGGVVSD